MKLTRINNIKAQYCRGGISREEESSDKILNAEAPSARSNDSISQSQLWMWTKVKWSSWRRTSLEAWQKQISDLLSSPQENQTQQFVHKPYELLDPEEVLKEKR